MHINVSFKDTLNSIIVFCNEYKKQIFIVFFFIFICISLYRYIQVHNRETPTVNKTYSKINLQSDINILDCKLKQRECYYENITNSLESAIENCKENDYCDSLK